MATVINISERYFTRSDNVFRERRKVNEDLWWAYLGRQDFSDKTEWQNKETTPGFPIAVEHVVGTFERSLTDTDDWLAVQPPGPGVSILPPEMIGEGLMFYLERLYQPGNHPDTEYGVQTFVSDAAKRALFEPIIIAKVYPVITKRRIFKFGRRDSKRAQGSMPAHDLVGKQESKPVDIEVVRLAIELVPYEDYYPDPSPERRYEIHRTRRNLYDLMANPEYDQDVVKTLLNAANEDYTRKNQALKQAQTSVGDDPYEIEVFEAWGDIIDYETGQMMHENVFWTWARGKILRQPTPNPFWDGTRPFVTTPLIRVPGSIVGKALADHAVPMWRAANELINLHLDSAAAGAWGKGQVRTDIMEAPEDVADGIPQGYTAVLKPNTPQGLQFYERVDQGEASQVTLDGLNRLDGYLQEALAVPDTKLGQLPQRATKATEIVQAMQSSGSLYESFAARLEDNFLEPIFEKAWRLIIQYAEDFLEDELIQIFGPSNVVLLENMPRDMRFRMLAGAHFRVRGLRGIATRERRFNKLMTVVNLLGTVPQFADHFGQRYSFEKLWEQLLRETGIDPMLLSIEDAEAAATAPPGTGGGQLEASLLTGGAGGSQPNILNEALGTPQAQAGALGAPTAATNPAANLAA